MEEVLGIGGIAFRARNPAGLARWYAECLGMRFAVAPGNWLVWLNASAPPAHITRSAGPSPQTQPDDAADAPVLLTLRVRDIDAMLRQLQANGVNATCDGIDYAHGAFARLTDPEGNVLILWESAATDAHD
jgi:predicted enzyme related to lactoylglutathione lyase